MAATSEKTAFIARLIVEAIEVDMPQRAALSRTLTPAHEALTMAARLLETRANNGNTEVTIFDDAAALAMGARKIAQHTQKKTRDAGERQSARIMFALAQAVLAYWGKRTDDGSHVYDSPLLWLKEAERCAA